MKIEIVTSFIYTNWKLTKITRKKLKIFFKCFLFIASVVSCHIHVTQEMNKKCCFLISSSSLIQEPPFHLATPLCLSNLSVSLSLFVVHNSSLFFFFFVSFSICFSFWFPILLLTHTLNIKHHLLLILYNIVEIRSDIY